LWRWGSMRPPPKPFTLFSSLPPLFLRVSREKPCRSRALLARLAGWRWQRRGARDAVYIWSRASSCLGFTLAAFCIMPLPRSSPWLLVSCGLGSPKILSGCPPWRRSTEKTGSGVSFFNKLGEAPFLGDLEFFYTFSCCHGGAKRNVMGVLVLP
jgi:hypothetical protein